MQSCLSKKLGLSVRFGASQWQLCRENLTEANGRRAMWPVDIGNYRFNRSASYGACAATAVEMGDQDTANRILDFLNEDYPTVLTDGVAHRPKASLWAHALEFTAIAGDHNALQAATTTVNPEGPVIAEVNYPDVLLASAKSKGDSLRAVLYPGAKFSDDHFSISGRVKSFGHAARGAYRLLRFEHSAWIQLTLAFMAVVAGLVLDISYADWRWIILVIGIVLMAEGLNTAIEKACDRISLEYSDRIKAAKDLAAGAVLLIIKFSDCSNYRCAYIYTLFVGRR